MGSWEELKGANMYVESIYICSLFVLNINRRNFKKKIVEFVYCKLGDGVI